MSPSILVIGAGGMLGHKMFQILSTQFEHTYGTLRGRRSDPPFDEIDLFQSARIIQDVDLMKLDRLDSLLQELRPDVIVNCAGIVKQRQAAKDAIPSITVNALLPHRLAAAQQGWSGRLIHFSTDCVFSGSRGHYSETDEPDASDLYGRSKFLGETAAANALTLRTSIIGRELQHFESLLEWFLHQQATTIRGFRQVFWSGVTTNYLAELVARIIREQPTLHGLYQLSSGKISKFDLLTLLRNAYEQPVEIEPDDTTTCDRSLNGQRFEQATGYRCAGLPSQIRELAADSTPYSEWLNANAVTRG